MTDTVLEINDAFLPSLSDKNRFLILYGGSGSGKSVFASQKLLLRCVSETNFRGVVVRKVARTIRESCFKRLKNEIADWGIGGEFKVNETEMKLTHVPTGNEIISAGLDDVEKLKSIEEPTCIWVEEATECDLDDIDQLDLRLRGTNGGYKQIILTFNPVDERNPLKIRFFDQEQPVTAIVKTTFRDNHFLDDEYRETLELKAKTNPNYYRIYYLGEWGKEEVGRPFVYNFEDRHIGKVEKKEGVPLRFSIDFNVDPFVCIAGQIWQDKEGHHIRILKEHILQNKSVADMIELIQSSYTQMELANCIWTGDATQRKRTVEQNIKYGENLHAWSMINKAFRLGKRLHTPKINPSVKVTRELCNFAFALHPDIVIDEDCSLLINELRYTEATEEGGIVKKNRNDPNQRADALDCWRYLLNTWCWDMPKHPRKYGIR